MTPLLLAVGVLSGTLIAPSGHPVGGARLEAVHLQSEARHSAQSDDLGAFLFSGLPEGTYVLRVSGSGFKPLVTAPVDIGPGKTGRLSLLLELDTREEQVTVQYKAPLLQTESAVVGHVVTGSTAAVLPLAGRNLAQLALLLPGIVTTAPASLAQPKLDDDGRPYVNGHREQGNSFVLDGVDTNDPFESTQPYHPSLEAVEEVRFETNNYSAAYGHVAGAMIQATIKSGSNELRGSLFAQSRPRKLSANRWELNRIQADRPRLRQKTFGATLGGPLWRDRLFFFADYEGYEKNERATTHSIVAPLQWRSGDFSDLLASPIPIRLRDPWSPWFGFNVPDPSRNGILLGMFYERQFFPGNVIAPSRIHPAVGAFLADPALYPAPNAGTNTYKHEVARPVEHQQGDLKLTAQATARDNLSVRLSARESASSSRSLDWAAWSGAHEIRSPFRSAAFNWNHVFGAGGLSQLQLGYNRLFEQFEVPFDERLGDANVAIGLEPRQTRAGLSAFSFGATGLTSVGNAVSSTANKERLYFASEHVSLLRGRHHLKAGAEWLHARIHSRRTGDGGLLGSYAFGTGISTFAFADFLLGEVESKLKGVPEGVSWEQVQDRIGLYVEDVFRPSSRLTTTLGLRWSYYSPWVETADRQKNFDLIAGEERLPGVAGQRRGLYEPYYRGFEPRLGVTWTVRDGLVLRAGYGVVQSMEGIPAHRRLTQNPPYFRELTQTYEPLAEKLFGFEDTIVEEQTLSGPINAFDPELKPQWTQQWNVFVERALSRSLTVNVGYVGHRARRLLVPIDANQPLPGPGPYSLAGWGPDQTRRPFYGRWPEVTTIALTTSSGRSRYDSLQAVLRQRPTRGVDLTASYTWSKAFTHNVQHSGGDPSSRPRSNSFAPVRDLDAEYGPAWFDVTHNFALSGSYQLPGVLAGTTVTTIATWHSGFPITVVDSRWRSRQSSGSDRPNRVGSGRVPDPTPDRWLDITAWEQAPKGTLGNSGVGILRGPTYASWNVGLSHAVRLYGRARLVLRLQAYNVLNRPNFGLPQRDLADPTNFGKITDTIDMPRQLEVGLKLEF